MRAIRRTALTSSALVVAGLAATLGATTQAAQADPNLTNVPAHRHFIVTPDGTRHAIGPQICGRPELQRAFNQFHHNIHIGSASEAWNHPHNPVSISATGC